MTSCKETESRSSADVENDRAGVNIKHWCYIQPAQYHYNMMATNDFYWRTLEKYTWRVHWCWYASPEVLLIDMRSMLRVRKDQGCPEFPPGGFDLPLLRCLSPKTFRFDYTCHFVRLVIYQQVCSICATMCTTSLANRLHVLVGPTMHITGPQKKKQIQRVSSTNIAIRLHVWVRPTADITGTTSADWFALRSSQQAKIQMVAGSTIGVTGKTSAIFPRCILSQENFCTG